VCSWGCAGRGTTGVAATVHGRENDMTGCALALTSPKFPDLEGDVMHVSDS